MPDLVLLSLLCSKLCHDLVGPVSAVGNGVEILEDENDPEMRQQAIGLLAHSAELAANRLKFMRLAFGAAGGEGVAISINEARQTAADFLADGRGELVWPSTQDEEGLGPDKTGIKVLLNLILIANDTIPRGGQVHVTLGHGDMAGRNSISAPRAPVRAWAMGWKRPWIRQVTAMPLIRNPLPPVWRLIWPNLSVARSPLCRK